MEEKHTSIFENGLIWFGAAVSIAEILTGTYSGRSPLCQEPQILGIGISFRTMPMTDILKAASSGAHSQIANARLCRRRNRSD